MKAHVIFAIAAALAGCNGSAPETHHATEAASGKEEKLQTLTVNDAMTAFATAKLPVGQTEVSTAENDTNQLLGRPGQYVGKVNWTDTRHSAPDTALANTIEAFANEDDLRRRQTYIGLVTKDTPMLLQYVVAHKNLLLRLDKSLTPQQAKEYERAIQAL